MRVKIADIKEKLANAQAKSVEELENLRIQYLGRKGEIQDLFKDFRLVKPEDKKEMGQQLNQLKEEAHELLNKLKDELLGSRQEESENSGLDLSLPVSSMELGSRHPLSLVRNQIIDIFSRIGFTVEEGPEIEDDAHNFEKLNFPPEHPARDMQDTFFIETNPDVLLRTHTSSVQVRTMEHKQPPIRSIYPGRVFRNEAISARAHCIFHQVEGLFIAKEVSFADLRQTLLYFTKEMFDSKTEIRFRPSYFPFTEPSAEMDISCNICGGKGCNICKGSGWVEILGCGMVDPNVLSNCGIDPNEYSGFAFGMGIERIAMLKHQVNDLRLFYENNVKFLRQFSPNYL